LKILALVLARGGSKRIPGKNIRILGGKPLIEWSIDIVRNIPEICDILVSTDDAAIAKVAAEAGAMVPWMRPAELATDDASSIDACLHAIQWYEDERGKVDGVLLLQPTSPFRSRESVLQGIELFRENNRHGVVGVSRAESHPLWCFKFENNQLRPFVDTDGLHLRSQDLPPAYVINGALYLVSPEGLRQLRSFFSDDMVPLIMKPGESIDIDTEWDWKIAEMMISAQGRATESGMRQHTA
jgi:CMP-N,N'-diacetyllegionaminic acid synthase